MLAVADVKALLVRLLARVDYRLYGKQRPKESDVRRVRGKKKGVVGFPAPSGYV